MDLLSMNKEYYNRNAELYERSSWYFFNRYKRRMIVEELGICLSRIDKEILNVLELGPGTGYLLSELVRLRDGGINYCGIEHSVEMSELMKKRFAKNEIKIITASITLDLIDQLDKGQYDMIIGHSILHHLPDYDKIISCLPDLLSENGIIYFAREPVGRCDIKKPNLLNSISNYVYSAISSILLQPSIKGVLWPEKIKQEGTKGIAPVMFQNGVEYVTFSKLFNKFELIIYRRYNRRPSSVLCYIENKYFKKSRKDIFGNTLFSIGVRKIVS